MKINVIGLGYIGLPTACLMASKGYEVHGIDVDEEKLKSIKNGKCDYYERGLDDLLSEALKSGILSLGKNIAQADVHIICVPTPLKNGKANLEYLQTAIKNLIPHLKLNDLIILESTVPVGTTRNIANEIISVRPELRKLSQLGVNIAFCPERVLPGNLLNELINNNRIVGGLTKDCATKAQNFYSLFVSADIKCASSLEISEISKLVENSYRDVNIAFANELSMICSEIDRSIS